MKNFFILAVLLWSGMAPAATYYVSSSTGSDLNSGTSSAAAWKTLAKVNGQVFQAADSILLKRGDVWNESLAPLSSGSPGSPIAFDAYGTGAPPNLTGYYAVPSSAWTAVTSTAWKAPVPSTFSTINFCLFGSVWGQKVGASSSNLAAQWDFYFANGYLYVYSASGNPANYYGAPIVPMALSNVPVINVNGKSWLTFQHLLVNWFDEYGVYVQGASDHLVFANVEVDSMIPQGTQPLGFYVNEGAPGPGDIKIYNSESHMNYDAFRFDGAATAIAMVNDKAYGNRDGALVDNTGAVNYSYCHFYGSSLAVAGSTDVLWTSGSGPTAGIGNVAADTAPAVQAWQRYPAQVTLTVDDAGMTAGADAYYANTVLPIADAAGVPVGAAITVGYPLAQTLIPEFQSWVNAGRDVTSHSMSHTYYTNTSALTIQYTGNGTAAALSISNQTLTITVTGAADTVSYSLAQGQAQGTIAGLLTALNSTGKFTATLPAPPCQGPYGTGCSYYTASALLAQDLADVSGQDVKSSVYLMQLDVTRLTTDEITLSRRWMSSNLTGLPATPVYVYPGGYETTAMQGIASDMPYAGARGALKEDLGVKDTYGSGFDVQNLTSFGVNPSWMGLQAAALKQKVQALVWKEMVWGVPWGIFWHFNASTGTGELSATEVTNLIADLQASGATIQSNTGLVNWLMGGTLEAGTDGNFYYKSAAASMTVDFRPTVSSPVVDAGLNLGAAYQIDINGMNQNSYGSRWEIGAHAFAAYSTYGQANAGTSSHFVIGTPVTSGPSCTFAAGALGGVEASCNNPNTGAPTVMCVAFNGTPSSNGLGTGCQTGFALSPVASGGTGYAGYFNFNQALTVKVVAGVNGQTDSAVASYNETVPAQTILANNFGWQCGFGVSTNCPITGGVLTWPASSAMPATMRLHDTGFEWSVVQPYATTWNWQYVDDYLDALAAHQPRLAMVQFTAVPCWAAPTGSSCGQIPNYGNATNAPPTDIGTGPMGSSPTFNTFVSNLLAHCNANGRCVSSYVQMYQLWNEWNLCVHWNGTAAQLYQLTQYPAMLIRAAIPNAVLAMPSATPASGNCQSGNAATDLATWLNLENTNGRISDLVDWHLYLTATSSTTNTPEQQWGAYSVNMLNAQAGVAGWKAAPWIDSETNFDAGTGYACPSAQYTAIDCTGQIVRWQILHNSNGAVGVDWYYGNTTLGQISGYATAYSNMEQYLAGGYFTAAAAANGGIWTAPFIKANGGPALFVWTPSESGATYQVPAGYSDYRDFAGGQAPVSTGQNITVGVGPIMLE